MTREFKEWFAHWLQSILALKVLLFRHQPEGLPKSIPDVDVYEANGNQGDDWEPYLKAQGQVWICTSLHHTKSALRNIRKASGGGTWHEKEKIYEDADCCVREYIFKVKSKKKQQTTNERKRHRKYTMIEYTRKEDKPKHAICRLTVVNKKNATSQQPQQQQGGNIENAAWYSNQSNLEMFLAQFVQGGEISEFRKNFTKDYIVQIFSRNMDEKPAASPMEHITEAAVRNPRKRSHGNNMKTIMEANVSTQRKKQAKVECKTSFWSESPIFRSELAGTDPNPDTDISYYDGNFENAAEYHNLPVFEGKGHKHRCGQNFSDAEIHETFSRTGYENKRALRKTSAMNTRNADYLNPINDQPNTSIYPTIQGRLVHQIIGQNAGLQDPNQLSPTFTVNYTEAATDNQNRIAPDPSTSTNTNIWFNQDPNQLSPNFIAATEGRLGHQDPDNLSVNFNPNSVEGMENNNQLPSYNQNTIAPGSSTSNHATIELEISDWKTIVKELSDHFDMN